MTDLTAQEWQQIEEAFTAACELEGEDRAAFLSGLAVDHPPIHAEVVSLLEVHGRAGSLLEESALAHLTSRDGGPQGAAQRQPGTAEPASAELVGRLIGAYRIIGLIARGGMGSVYLAERADDQYHQQVAIKLIQPGLARENLLQRFHTERQVLANLSHPNIARLLDGGTTDDGIPYLVMEYVKGTRVDEWCDQRRLSIDDRIRLFLSVCASVQHAHQNLIIHRDLKPSNILVAEGSADPAHAPVKLLDFGIAKVLAPENAAAASATSEATLTVERRLTPAYASPEQVRADAPITTASDVYSLGVVLYELLTGCRPYPISGTTDAALERAVCELPPLRPSDVLRTATGRETRAPDSQGTVAGPDQVAALRLTDLPKLRRQVRGDLETILLKALEKDPARRYATVQQFADDLRRFLHQEPISAHPPSTFYQVSRFIQRNRLLTGATAAVAIALLLGTTIAMAGLLQARAATAEAQRQTQVAETVNRFLNERLLGAASPERIAETGDITVRALLDVAAAEIERGIIVSHPRAPDDAQSPPELEAAIRLTIGRTYRTLGDYSAAEPHLEAAVRLHEATYGPDHPGTLRARDQLAVLYALQARYDEAEKLQHEVMEASQRIRGVSDADQLTYMSHFASLLDDRGQTMEALELRTRIVESSKLSNGHHHPDTLGYMIGLGHLHMKLGQLKEAEAVLTKALERCRRQFSDEAQRALPHPLTLYAMNNLAMVYDRQNRPDDSYPLHAEALEAKLVLMGDEHPSTLTSMHNLGLFLLNQQRFDQAENLLTRSLKLSGRVLGDDHPHTIESRSTLGFLYLQSGRHDQAEPLLVSALEQYIDVHGEIARTTAGTMHNIARLRFEQGDYEAAEAMFSRLLLVLDELIPPHHPARGNVLAELGRCLLRLERYQEAEAMLTEGCEILLAALGPEHSRTQRARAWLDKLHSRVANSAGDAAPDDSSALTDNPGQPP